MHPRETLHTTYGQAKYNFISFFAKSQFAKCHSYFIRKTIYEVSLILPSNFSRNVYKPLQFNLKNNNNFFNLSF